jgi:predicted sugar kinase
MPTHSQVDISGDSEKDYFAKLGNDSPDLVERLRCIIQQQLMPAAVAADFAAFGCAVAAYNESSGQLFRNVQGGAFNGKHVTNLIAQLRANGLTGIGQSSWGPGVFAWFESSQSLDSFLTTAKESRSFQVIATARPRNEGRVLTIG